MARPVATALISGAHEASYAYTTLPKSITLTGDATNGPILEWEWSVLPTDPNTKGGYPAGSVIATGVVGNFTNGKSSSMSLSVTLDLIGGYCFTLRARNADGWSMPLDTVDGTSCQAIVYILSYSGIKLPPEHMFRYADDLNATLVVNEIRNTPTTGSRVRWSSLGYAHWDPYAVGGYCMVGNAAGVVLLAGVPAKIAGSTTTGFTRSMTHTTNRLTYNGLLSKLFSCHAAACFSFSTSSSVVSLYFAVNGAVIAESQMESRITTGGDHQAVPVLGEAPLSTNHYVELWGAADKGGTLVVDNMQICVDESCVVE